MLSRPHPDGLKPSSGADAAPFRIAADIGGTFTDLAALSPDGVITTRKIPSTPDDYARAILDGLNALTSQIGLSNARIGEVLHASTIATNAILEGRGALTALVTTAGFRDVLELKRIRVPRLYEPLYCKPSPLVPRRRRFELDERLGPRGEVLRPLDPDQVRDLARELARIDVEAVAISFLHSYANPDHERAVSRILRDALPGRFICASSEILPEIREYERTSTTVVNAYIGPPVTRYLRSLQKRLGDAGIGGRLLMMQSSGGTLDVERLIAKPARIVESGPAAGVVGAARLGTLAGYRDIITFDMGGTTAKASLIENGALLGTDEYEVGGGVSLSSRLVKGGGYALKLPVIDVSEVGAGGGSLVWIDEAGALKVGPRSAGALPGPACYGTGGTEPTVTDANVVLGFINPEALAGGSVAIDSGLARDAIERLIAGPLGCDVYEAAWGIHRVANASMMRAVKAVSTYRGRDPRDFTLFAFGGNGGVHAVELARELQIRRVVVPPAAGVFSAIGLLFADFEVSHSCAFLRPAEAEAAEALDTAFSGLEAQVHEELGPAAERAAFVRRADLRYRGQAFELPVSVPDGPCDEDAIAVLRTAFEREHERSYGHRLPGAPGIDFVALRAIGTVPPQIGPGLSRHAFAQEPGEQGRKAERQVYFGREFGLLQTPVLARSALAGGNRSGPLVVEEHEGATVIPPDARAALDAYGNIVLDL